jgi:peptide/nickel transport system permease protein
VQNDNNLEVYEVRKIPSMWAIYWREIRADKACFAAFIIICSIMLFVLIAAPLITTEAAARVNLSIRNQAPSWVEGGREGYILGTDGGGRNMYYLLVVAARNSIYIGFGVAILSIIIGIVVGLVSGYYGGQFDNIVMRIVDTWSMIPSMMFIIVMIELSRATGGFTIMRFIFLLTAFGWMGRARLIRNGTLQQSNLDYVSASKTSGTPNAIIILREILPNMVPIIMPNVVMTMSGSIGIEVGLTILGFGLPIGTPSLGTIIQNATILANLQNRWWTWLPGVLLMFVMMMSINFVGQAMQRAADPKQRLV